MRFFGDIDLNDNEMQQMVMEVETSFPADPRVGRVVFRDRRLYICVEIAAGIPTWVPITREIDTAIHVESPASATWNIQHNLQTNTPLVQVYDAATGQLVIPDEVTIVDLNNVTVTFATPLEGRAIVMNGNTTGAERATIAFEHFQTTLATDWVINHGLGFEPLVRVFIGNQEVQPDSITHNTLNQVTVSFTTPQVGFARLI